MSLTVYPFLRNQTNDEITELEHTIDSNHNDLFGLESWRFRVWGATALKEMGCTVLPALSNTNIYAEKEELYQLERELEKVHDQMESLALLLKIDKDSLAFRIKNALTAIDVAKKYQNGGVCIS